MSSSLGIRARPILKQDKADIAALLAKGLRYSVRYYQRVLDYLDEHPTPQGFPKYGYLLEDHGQKVGAILLIFTEMNVGNISATRCHVTSWYVEPAYRCYATLFFAKALKRENVSYLNISARPDTREIIKVQGFSRYSNGQFLTFPLLNPGRVSHATVVGGDAVPNAPHDPFELDLLVRHGTAGCITMWCMTPERAYPFVFRPLLFKHFMPGVQLVYCSSLNDLVRFIRPIGLSLATRGRLFLKVDANGHIPGLLGMYFDDMEPRYYKGSKPRSGDIAFTQFAMCGRAS